ncbi:hypothetical protein MSG28_008824 [Choristoneura fumiferana]|uniref:Uncharacterized protein n=1 Tax=Choristoneura fumiferana TaxID=7141 RepID=A0ACC0J868_CHOFU|nr:hypothetical protein MSG28_008824 [Choristoneura fumiferana]
MVLFQVERFHRLATVLFSGAAGARGCVALTPRRVRTLARRRAAAAAPPDLAHALHAVLGADDVIPEPPQPFEEVPSVAPDTWDVGEDEEEPSAGEGGEGAEWAARHARLELYDQLCRYFRPSAVPPPGDITDLVAL